MKELNSTINITCISTIRTDNLSFSRYCDILEDKINIRSDFNILPEYCWGKSSLADILKFINILRDRRLKTNIIFGTFPFQLPNNKQKTNNAIILTKTNSIEYVQKTHVLFEESKSHGITGGINNNVFTFSDINFGVVICADLWNSQLIKNLIVNKKIQLLFVPAFTVVPKGYSNYAKYQWYSLSIARSREFVLPIIIADHKLNTEKYDVGNATSIADPSVKHESIKKQTDFLVLPDEHGIINYKMDLEKINEYRQYRKSQGLYVF